MAFREIPNMGKHRRTLLPLIRPRQPAGRFIAEQHADEEERSGKALHRERDLPGRVSLQMKKRAVVDPESNHGAHRLEQLVQAHQHTSRGARSVLRDVSRRQHGGGAESQTLDKTSDIQTWETSGRRCLEHSAHSGEDCGAEKGGFAAPFMRERIGEKSSGEGASLYDGDDVGG